MKRKDYSRITPYQTKRGETHYMIRHYVTRFGESVQVKKCFSNIEEAKSYLADVLKGNKNCLASKITFEELYFEYIEAYKLRNRPQSIRREESLFKNQILPFFSKAKVIKISVNDYMEWQRQILDKGFSDSYNKALHTAMVSIFKYAKKIHKIDDNIPQEVGGFKKRRIKVKMKVWNLQDFVQFLSVVDNEIDYVLFSVLYETGIRFGELAALTFEDYDGKSFYINKTISKEKDAFGNHIINAPKTASSERRVSLSEDIIKSINALKAYWSKFEGFNDSWYIFGGIKPVSHTTITRKKNKYCKEAGVPQIKLHEFRHSHVSYLLSNNIPITNISNRVGHSNPQITYSIYSHMLESEEDPILSVLNDSMKAKS